MPDDSPYTTGGVGLLGTKPSQEALEKCDTLLMVGTSFPYIEFYPKPGQARCVQIDIDPSRIGLRYPVEVGIVADCKRRCRSCCRCSRRTTIAVFSKAQEGMKKWDELMRGARHAHGQAHETASRRPGTRQAPSRHAIVSCDSGTIATWFARHIPAKRGQMYSLSGNTGDHGLGLPYAIAAQVAYPDRQWSAFVGDGGFTMLMGEFATAVKTSCRSKWSSSRTTRSARSSGSRWSFWGIPSTPAIFSPIDFAAFARACGGTASDRRPGECGAILDQALALKGPVLVEAVVDPHEPPMPPKVTLDQVEKLAKALAKGTPNRKQIALTIASDKVRELV